MCEIYIIFPWLQVHIIIYYGTPGQAVRLPPSLFRPLCHLLLCPRVLGSMILYVCSPFVLAGEGCCRFHEFLRYLLARSSVFFCYRIDRGRIIGEQYDHGPFSVSCECGICNPCCYHDAWDSDSSTDTIQKERIWWIKMCSCGDRAQYASGELLSH